MTEVRRVLSEIEKFANKTGISFRMLPGKYYEDSVGEWCDITPIDNGDDYCDQAAFELGGAMVLLTKDRSAIVFWSPDGKAQDALEQFGCGTEVEGEQTC